MVELLQQMSSPTVCKNAVSKLRTLLGEHNRTALHDPSPSIQHGHTRLTRLNVFPPYRLYLSLFWRRVMVVVLLKPAFLMSLNPTVMSLRFVSSLSAVYSQQGLNHVSNLEAGGV